MANVVDTKLYDILGVSPSASENELKKASTIWNKTEMCSSKGKIEEGRVVISETWPRNKTESMLAKYAQKQLISLLAKPLS